METLIYIYIFVVGAVFGSFFNVVGLRTAEKKSIIYPRSHCTTCKRNLNARELIPILSFLLQKRKCRGCGTKISFQYPCVEILTGSLFVLMPFVIGWSSELIVAYCFISLLIIISISDLKKMIIPDRVVLFFLFLVIPLRILIPLEPWWNSIAGGLAGFSLLLLLAIVSKGGMGGGDIKLMGVIGLFIGLQATIMAIFLASFIGALIGGIVIILKKRSRKAPIPFGPFLAIGSLISYLYGSALLDWYMSLFTNGGLAWIFL